MIQKTLIVLKPDAVKRGIVGEIITRFEKVGLQLNAMKMVWVDDELAHKHYEGIGTMITRYGQDIFQVNAEFMKSGPVVAMVWEGVEAIALVRKMVGSTEPKSSIPGTIRGDYSHASYGYVNSNNAWLTNLVHASANEEEAAPEIALWFNNEEIHNHEMIGQEFKRGHK
jgi:nucleoside-diphosphate kinase